MNRESSVACWRSIAHPRSDRISESKAKQVSSCQELEATSQVKLCGVTCRFGTLAQASVLQNLLRIGIPIGFRS